MASLLQLGFDPETLQGRQDSRSIRGGRRDKPRLELRLGLDCQLRRRRLLLPLADSTSSSGGVEQKRERKGVPLQFGWKNSIISLSSSSLLTFFSFLSFSRNLSILSLWNSPETSPPSFFYCISILYVIEPTVWI